MLTPSWTRNVIVSFPSRFFLQSPPSLYLDFNESFDELVDSDARTEYRFRYRVRRVIIEEGDVFVDYLRVERKRWWKGGGRGATAQETWVNFRSLWRKSANWIFGVSPRRVLKVSLEDFARAEFQIIRDSSYSLVSIWSEGEGGNSSLVWIFREMQLSKLSPLL